MSFDNIGRKYSLRNLYHILVTMLAASPHIQQGAEASVSRRQTMLEETKTTPQYIQSSTHPSQAMEHKFIGFIGGEYCSTVKKITGVEYDQLENKYEPDLSHLKLDFQSDKESHSFYLGDLATAIPNMRGLNGSKPLIIFMHGFTDDPTRNNFHMINKALHSIEHFNILGLDAGPLLSWLYLRATTYVRFIGEKLGETLVAMTKQGLDPNRVHLIGHSLGAHIAGFAGAEFKKLTGKKVGRVTGLDPAGPCFASVNETLRLNHRQAKFVDVIHTNAGVYGISTPGLIGHADFFPNGGAKQPNCFFSTCSHSRAVELYAESIVNHTAFYSVRCADVDHWYEKKCSDTFRVAGHGASTQTRGKFYLRTEGTSPYGLGMDGMFYKSTGWWFWGERQGNNCN